MIGKIATNDAALEKAMTRVLDELNDVSLDAETRGALLTELERLHTLKTANRLPRVSPDALISAAASVIGIVVIVAYEQLHPMTSQGLKFVKKP